MTHQYKSEVLNKLMERDGINIPSSVPPYEAEIKDYLINQVIPGYPKLTDYEAEWLVYNYTKHLPADFPISSVSNVTEASFENVVPFAYQSAILKGDTKYRDIDTRDILDTFDETKNLELVSVKMPVLSTIGKNLFDLSKATHGYITSTGEINTSTTNVKSDYIKINPSDNYSVKSWGALIGGNFSFYDNNKNFILRTPTVSTTTSPTNASYMIFHTQYVRSGEVDLNNVEIIIIKGTIIPTIFEPFKSNILTVNEDVVLCSIGNVRDELDLLTGEVTQKLIEFEFNDGGYFGDNFTEFENTIRWQTTGTVRQLLQLKTGGKILSTRFTNDNSNDDYEHIRLDGSVPYSNVVIYLNKTKASTHEELKTYLKNNPFTIVAEKTEKSIKTVDLKIVNESGESIYFMPLEGTMHVQSSGEPIQPTFDMSVPVEATTQNLASFTDLEMEE